MKRLAGWLFNFAAAASLLLFGASITMWVRSHYVGDRWYWPDAKQLASNIGTAPQLAPGGGQTRAWVIDRNKAFTAGLAFHGNYVLNSAPGAIEFVIDSPPWPRVQPYHSHHDLPPGPFWGDAHGTIFVRAQSQVIRWSWLGFSYQELSGYSGGSSFLPRSGDTLPVLVRRWTAPYWSLVVLLGLSPPVWLIGWMHRHGRYAAGQCRVCGYDLRATPDRCPECGTISPTTSLPG